MKREITKNRIEEEWHRGQLNFVSDLRDRMTYLKQYFDGKYKPLKAGYDLFLEEDEPSIILIFKLIGENDWSVQKRIVIDKLGIGIFGYSSQVADRYTEEIQHSFEEEVRKEGIRSINTRKV